MALDVDFAEYKASILDGFVEVELVSLSYSAWPETLYLSYSLPDGKQYTLPSGEQITIRQVPMKLTGEDQDGLVSNTRTLTVTGLNDIVAKYDDLVDKSKPERVVCEVFTVISDLDGNLSNVKSHFKYHKMGTDYSEKDSAASIRLSTQPTNENECGVLSGVTVFPSMEGIA